MKNARHFLEIVNVIVRTIMHARHVMHLENYYTQYIASTHLALYLLTWTIPATCEGKLSLKTTSPVVQRLTSILPFTQPVTR